MNQSKSQHPTFLLLEPNESLLADPNTPSKLSGIPLESSLLLLRKMMVRVLLLSIYRYGSD